MSDVGAVLYTCCVAPDNLSREEQLRLDFQAARLKLRAAMGRALVAAAGDATSDADLEQMVRCADEMGLASTHIGGLGRLLLRK